MLEILVYLDSKLHLCKECCLRFIGNIGELLIVCDIYDNEKELKY